jgi:anti-anti-sigma factor
MKQAAKNTSRRTKSAATALQIDGDMTIYQADELKQKLLGSLAGPATGLQVDLHNVGEIDSAGVQLLIAAKHAATAVGKTLTLTACSNAVTEVLELFGLVSFFADSTAAAAAAA